MSILSRYRPSPAMVVAIIALFAATGGVSYGVATGSIDSREIKNNTIRSKDIRNSNVRTQDVRNNNLRGRDVRNNTLTGADINEGTLGPVPFANSAGSAGSATTASRATTAGSADTAGRSSSTTGFFRSGRVTLERDAGDTASVEIGRVGSFIIRFVCDDDAGDPESFFEIENTEDNGSLESDDGDTDPDFDEADSPLDLTGRANSGNTTTPDSAQGTGFMAISEAGNTLNGLAIVQVNQPEDDTCAGALVAFTT